MKTVVVNGEARTDFGKKGASDVRRAGRIPCVMYGSEEVVHFSSTFTELKNLIYTPDFKLAEVNVNGKKYRAILKDVQFHPVTDNPVHVDLQLLVDGNPLKVELPIRFKGASPGVKAGGKLMQLVRRIKVKTTPEKLVDELYVNISGLELGQSIRIRDIDVEDGIEVLMSPGVPVAMIEIPRALRSAASAAEKG